MENDPKDKVVVITGGAMGFGYQIAKFFLKNGAKTIIILDNEETIGVDAAISLNDAYGPDKAVFMKCDVIKDLETVSSEILSKFKIDVFINNASIFDETSIRKTIEVNTIAVMEWGMKIFEHMRKDKGGSGGTIINIASIYGYKNDPWFVYYKTSKHAVIGFTKTLGHQLNYEKTGVKVFAVCPGPTLTTTLRRQRAEYHILDFDNKHIFIQTSDTVGEATVEMFRVARSGTAWVTKDDEPIQEVPL